MTQEQLFRVAFAVIFITVMSISGYYRRRARAAGETIARRQEGALALLLRLVFTLPLLLTIVLYLFRPDWLAWATFSLPHWARWAGVGLGLACIPLAHWVFTSIGSNISETVLTKKSHQLVTEGPYRWIRHPLYSTGLLLILSLGLIARNWFLLALWGVAFVVFRFVVIPVEERKLTEAFGDAYAQYRKHTGALVPRQGSR
jgi:protein-S-isoprenylcysteine O-methyltransferase Ste14